MVHIPFFIFIILVLTYSCSNIDKFPAKGKLVHYYINTTVDSKIAKYYLENYLQNKNLDHSLHKKIHTIIQDFKGKTLNRDTLKELTDITSVDFAALYFGKKLLTKQENDSIQKQFISNLKIVYSKKLPKNAHEYVFIIVPGLDYVEYGDATGANLKLPIEVLKANGLNAKFVNIHPMGTIKNNALNIAKVIKNNKDKKIIIVGPSSAGPAIHMALGLELKKSEILNIMAWINLGGLLNGTPLIDWFDSGVTRPIFSFLCWYNDWNKQTFDSMKTKVRQVWFKKLTLPKHIFILNYLGLSLSGDISSFGRDQYKILRRYGPNDALTLLPDAIADNSVTIIAPKSDHFFAEDPLIKNKTLAMVFTLFDNIEKGHKHE